MSVRQFDAQWINTLWDDRDGGANGDGTIFSIPVTGGTPTTLLSFNGTNGASSCRQFDAQVGSTLYGMTNGGGATATAPFSAFR